MLMHFTELDSLAPAFGSMRRELERAFGDSGSVGQRTWAIRSACPISLWQDDRHVYVEMDVPGMTQDHLELRFEDGKLWIRGERVWKEDRGAVDYNERRFGRFERAVVLPDIVDPSTIEAVLQDGVLQISVARHPDAQPKSIPIRAQATESTRKLADKSAKS